MHVAFRAALLAAVASAISPASAQTASTGSGQAYPTKPARIIIPFPPAGPTDNQARWAAQQLNAAFGQNFIADNRPGAGGITGTDAVAKAAPDGYTLLAGNPGPLTIAPTARLQHDRREVADSASCLRADPSVPGKGAKESIALAKARPGIVYEGAPGVGTVGDLAAELMAARAAVGYFSPMVVVLARTSDRRGNVREGLVVGSHARKIGLAPLSAAVTSSAAPRSRSSQQ